MNALTLYSKPIIAILLTIALIVCSSVCFAELTELGLNLISETINGKNTKGPYFLNYTEFDASSVGITVNGAPLAKGRDYTVDASRGAIAFTRAVLNSATLRVTYMIIPGKSAKSGGVPDVPIEMNLLKTEGTQLRMLGSYGQNSLPGTDTGKTLIGFAGDTKSGATNLSSLFLTGQANDKSAEGSSISFMDKSLYKVGGGYGLGNLKMSGSLSRAGTGFLGEKEYGIRAGLLSDDLSLAYTDNKLLQAAAKYQRTEDTVGTNAGNISQIEEQSLLLKPIAGTQLGLARTVTSTETSAANSQKVVEKQLLTLDGKLGERGTAAAALENAVVTTAAGEERVTTTRVNAGGEVDKRLSLSGSAVQSDSSLNGNRNEMNLRATGKPSEQVSVDVGVTTAANAKVGKQVGTDLSVGIKGGDKLSVNATRTQNDSTLLGESSKTDIQLDAAPARNVRVKGTVLEQANATSTNFSREMTVSGSAPGLATLTAGVSQSGTRDTASTSKSGSVEITPIANTTLGVGYKSTESASSQTTVTDYSASAKPADFLSVSGKLRQRDLPDSSLDSQQVKVALAYQKLLSLEGEYQSNPENEKGEVQSVRLASVGLRANVGSVGMNSSVAQKQDYTAGQMSQEGKLGFDIQLNRVSKFTTGLTVNRLLNGSDEQTYIYAMGFQRKVGADFDLSLTGAYTRKFRDNTELSGQDELRAQCSFSIKY